MKGMLVASVGAVFVLVLVIGGGTYSLVPPPAATPAAHETAAAQPAEAPPAPFTGTSTGCTEKDPTRRDGCLTPATAWLYSQTLQHFGRLPASCWDAHTWNPTSDHPKGKACDFTIGTAGQFPNDAERAHGWQVATWLKDNATALDIAYVIWDGQIWSAKRAPEGWRPYTGGDVYDPSTPTGGHYDHVHVSVREAAGPALDRAGGGHRVSARGLAPGVPPRGRPAVCPGGAPGLAGGARSRCAQQGAGRARPR